MKHRVKLFTVSLVYFIAVIWRTLGTVPSRDKVLQLPVPPYNASLNSKLEKLKE